MSEEFESVIPPFADMLRMLEAADSKPETSPWDDTAYLKSRLPELWEVETRDLALPGPHGNVPARFYTSPHKQAQLGFVWVHGGAFVAGDLDMAEANWVGLALAAQGIPVLSLDYHKCLYGLRFPVPSDDIVAGWTWATANAAEFGVKAGQLHLGGASAGANLVAGVTKRLHDGAGPLPASQILVYPLVHSVLPGWEAQELRRIKGLTKVIFSPEFIIETNWNYAGSETALNSPYTFAANGEVSGQPPTLILNCELDTLRSSGEAYGRQLASAGVEVRIELVEKAEHGCLSQPDNPEGQRTLALMAEWLKRRA